MSEVKGALLILGAMVVAGHVIEWWFSRREKKMGDEHSKTLHFTAEGKEYLIDFQRVTKEGAPFKGANRKPVLNDKGETVYDGAGKPQYVDGYKHPLTKVNIREVVGNLPRHRLPIRCSYTVGCSHKDGFTLSRGREAALRGICRRGRKVVGHHGGNPIYGDTYYVAGVSKEFVKAMWKAYMEGRFEETVQVGKSTFTKSYLKEIFPKLQKQLGL